MKYYTAWIVVCIINQLRCTQSLADDIFTEELLVKPLFGNQVYAHFNFATVWSVEPENENCKYTLQSRLY